MKLLARETSNKNYIKEIDGLRFVAIALVVIMHLSERVRKYSFNFSQDEFNNYFEFIISRGTVGVFLFFAISGFILSYPFAVNIKKGISSKPYSSYLKRRFTRIEPPYLLWMSIFFLILVVNNDFPFQETLSHYLASIFYVHNIVYSSYSNINPVAWSLEVELQFYLMAPFLAKLFFGIIKAKTRIIILSLIVILYPLVENALMLHDMPFKASLIGTLDFFLIGFILADLYINKNERLFTKSIFWDLIALISLFAMLNTYSTGVIESIILNFSILTLMISSFKGKYLNKILKYKWLTTIGGMCYTIYLIHLPLFELISSSIVSIVDPTYFLISFLLNSIVSIPALCIFSIIGFVIVEKPFMSRSSIKYFKSLKKIFAINSSKYISILKEYKYGVIILLLLCPHLCITQVSPSSDQLELLKVNLDDPSSIQLLPLSVLTELAKSNSPLLESTNISQHNLDIEIRNLKNKWTEYINFTASYLYGTSSYLDQSETVFAVDYSTLNRKSLFYHAGLTARIPLSEIILRKANLQKIENEQKILELQKEEVLLNIRKEIIHYYTQFHEKINILNIKNDELQSLELSTQYAEEALRNGQVDFVEYNKIISSKSQAKEEIAETRSQILLSYIMLCEITGQNVRL